MSAVHEAFSNRRLQLTLALLACLICAPLPSHAQTWDGFAEPPEGTDVIEVHRYGGFGPGAGGTLVSIDAAGRAAVLAPGQCPDEALVGRLSTPTFDDIRGELERAVASVRGQPARSVTDASIADIVREGRLEPLCLSPLDGVDMHVTLYSSGSKQQYKCVTGALQRFGESLLNRVFDAVSSNRATTACIERLVGPR
jgi:hypothetical protein